MPAPCSELNVWHSMESAGFCCRGLSVHTMYSSSCMGWFWAPALSVASRPHFITVQPVPGRFLSGQYTSTESCQCKCESGITTIMNADAWHRRVCFSPRSCLGVSESAKVLIVCGNPLQLEVWSLTRYNTSQNFLLKKFLKENAVSRNLSSRILRCILQIAFFSPLVA